MTSGGGLAAAFDGNTSQISTDCARKLNTATAGWIGKTLAAPSTIDRAIVYGPSDTGLSTSVNVILQLYGKTGAAPASSSDGTLLAQTGFVDDNFVAVPHHLSSNNKTTAWDHLWVILTPRALQSNIHIAEVEFYSEFSGSTSVSAQEIRIGNSSIYAIVNSSAVSVSNSFAVSDSFLTDMQIDNTSGTNIGDMTGSAGLAAAFDVDTLQVATESATITANAGYVGKTLVRGHLCSLPGVMAVHDLHI